MTASSIVAASVAVMGVDIVMRTIGVNPAGHVLAAEAVARLAMAKKAREVNDFMVILACEDEYNQQITGLKL
jgi:hypothetical protein